jgi:phage regulator Rha-like protein
MDIIKFGEIEKRIIVLRDIPVLLDSDVAYLYGVETRDINKAVKNNPDKFPKGYIFEVSNQEFTDLRWKISTTNILSMTRVLPKAFTEKGLYMLATILKSKKAVETTINIIETFAKMRKLSATINQMTKKSDEKKQKSLLKRNGEIISGILSDDLELTGVQTTLELNLTMFLKLKRTTTKEKRK